MAHDSKRKGATWKRFVAGFAIAAATTVAGAGMADAAASPVKASGTNIVATSTGGSTTTGPIVRAAASAQSGIRW